MLPSQQAPLRYSQCILPLLNLAMVKCIGMLAKKEPYIVPMNYAYEHTVGDPLGRVIIHGANSDP